MSKVLDRSHEVHEQPIEEVLEGVRVPDDIRDLHPEPTRPHRVATSVRWLPWMLLVAVLAIAGIVTALVLIDDGTQVARDVDGSFQTVETARFMALAPEIDASFEAAESARFEALVPAAPVSNSATESVPSNWSFEAPSAPVLDSDLEIDSSGWSFEAPSAPVLDSDLEIDSSG